MHFKMTDTNESSSLSDSPDYDMISVFVEIQKKLERLQSNLRLITEEKNRIERENAMIERQYRKWSEFVNKTYETGILDFKSLEEFDMIFRNLDETREQLDAPNSDYDMESNSIILGGEHAVRLCISLTLYLQPLLPNGASLGEIHAHLSEKGAAISVENLETVLRHHPTLFKEETVNENGILNKKWFFALELPPVPEIL